MSWCTVFPLILRGGMLGPEVAASTIIIDESPSVGELLVIGLDWATEPATAGAPGAADDKDQVAEEVEAMALACVHVRCLVVLRRITYGRHRGLVLP
jgi:hypothetical protein